MTGTFVSFSDGTLTLASDSGQDQNTTHKVDGNAAVTVNGKKSKMTDLRPGDRVSFTGDPATSLSVTR